MTVHETKIEGLLILEPQVFEDKRGYFFESFNNQKMPDSMNNTLWVQDNESKSRRGVLRGMHYQQGKHAQAKLVRAVVGEIYDFAVDLRVGSNTYGQSVGVLLNDQNKRQFYVPRGFAHGFVVLSDMAIFSYKCDNYYNKASEGGIRYDDPTLNLNWPINIDEVVVSDKDAELPYFGQHKLS